MHKPAVLSLGLMIIIIIIIVCHKVYDVILQKSVWSTFYNNFVELL